MSAETKTGIFFIVGVILLGVFTLKLEDVSKMMGRRYAINTSFSMPPGSPSAIPWP